MTASLVHLWLWSGLVYWALGQTWFAQFVDEPVCTRLAGARGTASRPLAPTMSQPALMTGPAAFVGTLPLALFGPPLPLWLHALNIGAGASGVLVSWRLLHPRPTGLTRWRHYRRWRTGITTLQAVLALVMLRLTWAP